MKRIIVVGSVNTDLVVRAARAPNAGETVLGQAFSRHLGGKGANQAVAAARLVDPALAQVALIGRIGGDDEGDFAHVCLAQEGVDVTALGRDGEAGTGVAAITLADGGENRIVVVAGANDRLSPGVLSQHHEVLTTADVLLLQLEIPLPTVQTAARMGREKRAIVILDPAPARPLAPALLRLCDFVTPNESELGLLVGAPGLAADAPWADLAAAGARLRSAGARRVVIKAGARGALVIGDDGEQVIPAPAVTAIDTTAAGDCWNGAFAAALVEGQPIAAAARFACTAAALSVTRLGAAASMPTREETRSADSGCDHA